VSNDKTLQQVEQPIRETLDLHDPQARLGRHEKEGTESRFRRLFLGRETERAGRKKDEDVTEMVRKANRYPEIAEVAVFPKALQDRITREVRITDLGEMEIPEDLLRVL
jgi:hypothetical protein